MIIRIILIMGIAEPITLPSPPHKLSNDMPRLKLFVRNDISSSI